MAIKVSIIEDDEPARKIFADWLSRSEGFELLSDHGSGESALKSLPANPPDVVLMDINLPGINGVETIRQLAAAPQNAVRHAHGVGCG